MSSHSKRQSLDSMAARFTDPDNKPDFKELDLGSPVSPLRSNNRASLNASTSSSSSSGSNSGKPNTAGNANSGELSDTSPGSVRPGHRRSVSAGAPLIYSGATFSATSSCSPSNGGATSPMLPSGNICPSGKILKTMMAARTPTKTDTLAHRSGNYGHGSIVRGGNGAAAKVGASDPEELKRAGNDMYRRGSFVDALGLYDKAIAISPENAAYWSNRAAALMALGKLPEAVRDCEEAVRIDPSYGRAHQRLASLYLRLGQLDNARHHLHFPGQHPDVAELQKLHALEKHIDQSFDARKVCDWKSLSRECDAAIAAGADFSPVLIACKAEALLKLHQVEDAESCLSSIPRLEHYIPSLKKKFFGMLAEAYVHYVRAQIEMALGRFENSVSAAEKAAHADCSSSEISVFLNNVKSVARARSHGNDLFSAGKYDEACSAYGEGLRYDSSNSVLYCNRAVCWSKLGLWAKSVEDCNQALKVQPNYTKALLRRAASNEKLGRWTEVIRDYEILSRELPGDNKILESLRDAQVALRKSHGEEVHRMKFIGEVEQISTVDSFKAAISSPGVAVVHFKAGSDEQCEQISPFVNMLCIRYPSIHFFKVDAEESSILAKLESIKSVPTFKIYKDGEKVQEMIRPSHQFLEDSVRNCIS